MRSHDMTALACQKIRRDMNGAGTIHALPHMCCYSVPYNFGDENVRMFFSVNYGTLLRKKHFPET